jgi:phosphoribosylamine---glycine ligase
VNGEPYVIEYNCRLGDPETQSVLPRLRNDLAELCLAVAEDRLSTTVIEEDERVSATVVLASGGYPGNYEKGKTIEGLDGLEGSLVFHAGTALREGGILTNGGRVLAVTSLAAGLPEAIDRSNRNASLIHFEGRYYRTDIGFDL